MSEPLKITCLVADDEEAAIDVMKHFISRVPYLELCGAYTSPLEALQAINDQHPQLIFVDIQMPDISGIDLVKNMQADSHIILTTAYSEYALTGYDLNVTDYLLKPVAFPRFLAAVEKVRNLLLLKNRQAAEKDFILVKGEAKGKFFKVDFNEIDYIEGLRNYVAIHCGNKKIVTLLNMKDLEEKLPADQFARIHKSFIVSVAKINTIEGNTISLKGHAGSPITIGDTYKSDFLEKMRGNS
ncbi:MAG: LytTR family DNA-binding domain-containing protein [Ferruginibacter sp.]